MRDAWDGGNAELAKKQLQRLAASLNAKHPGAAASLREGLEDTLTVQAMRITGALYRTLRTTNPIKNTTARSPTSRATSSAGRTGR